MLADDVRLVQSTYPPRAGRAEVGVFFTIYSHQPPAKVGAAWLDGREVVAVWDDPLAVRDPAPSCGWSIQTTGSVSSATTVTSPMSCGMRI
jgi:hypothetical protein